MMDMDSTDDVMVSHLVKESAALRAAELQFHEKALELLLAKKQLFTELSQTLQKDADLAAIKKPVPSSSASSSSSSSSSSSAAATAAATVTTAAAVLKDKLVVQSQSETLFPPGLFHEQQTSSSPSTTVQLSSNLFSSSTSPPGPKPTTTTTTTTTGTSQLSEFRLPAAQPPSQTKSASDIWDDISLSSTPSNDLNQETTGGDIEEDPTIRTSLRKDGHQTNPQTFLAGSYDNESM
jgi:hypothetical protein